MGIAAAAVWFPLNSLEVGNVGSTDDSDCVNIHCDRKFDEIDCTDEIDDDDNDEGDGFNVDKVDEDKCDAVANIFFNFLLRLRVDDDVEPPPPLFASTHITYFDVWFFYVWLNLRAICFIKFYYTPTKYYTFLNKEKCIWI